MGTGEVGDTSVGEAADALLTAGKAGLTGVAALGTKGALVVMGTSGDGALELLSNNGGGGEAVFILAAVCQTLALTW